MNRKGGPSFGAKRLYTAALIPYLHAFRRTRKSKTLLTPAWVNNLQGVT